MSPTFERLVEIGEPEARAEGDPATDGRGGEADERESDEPAPSSRRSGRHHRQRQDRVSGGVGQEQQPAEREVDRRRREREADDGRAQDDGGKRGVGGFATGDGSHLGAPFAVER